ncbi:cytochrome c biogenesis protein CcdA [Phytohabitans sp. ZYX-F-186]|uniref:Cytochrome c biogenesis protein CcdA n=1 Tax=Phytohabitans maris TaxID=3071409 RepID=A0ABU0ZRM8_9ACTN|nr:cytochrome c biogenesis protein CcdA [Phytohabitans sp. ZYX-F-186]MDQ7909657.1 cytochrome c biogenesis protein CcdA [Phytohabitans sp. ZYX-F-186]
MTQTTLVLALTAGMLAAVNPCGFALLPAYLSLLVAGESTSDTVRRALASTAAMTGGFVAVFGAFGLAVAPAAGWIQERLPWLTVALGVLLVAVGGWLAAGRTLPTPWRGPRAPELRRTLPSMFAFGAAYAAASLSCTIGPFLAIVVASMRAGSTGAGVGLFVAYAAGMGLAVGAAALAVGLLRTSLIRAVRRAGSAISRLGGVLLLLAGAYVAYYGWYEIRLSADRSTVDDPVVAAAGQIQHTLSAALTSAGVEVVAGAFAVLLAAALLARRLTRRSEVREEVRDGAGEERPQLRAGVGGHGTEPA